MTVAERVAVREELRCALAWLAMEPTEVRRDAAYARVRAALEIVEPTAKHEAEEAA